MRRSARVRSSTPAAWWSTTAGSGDFAHLSPNSALGGGVEIGDRDAPRARGRGSAAREGRRGRSGRGRRRGRRRTYPPGSRSAAYPARVLAAGRWGARGNEAHLPLGPAHGPERGGLRPRGVRLQLDDDGGRQPRRLRDGLLGPHRPALRGALERHRRHPPRPAPARRRPGRRGHGLRPHLRGQREPHPLPGRGAGIRRLGPDVLEHGSRRSSPRPSRTGRGAASSRGRSWWSTSTASPPTWTRSWPPAAATAFRCSRMRPRRLARSTRGSPAGTLGDVNVFSFNGNKIITTTSGGMLSCPNRELGGEGPLLVAAGPRPARRVPPHARWATTTGCPTCSPGLAAASSRSWTSGSGSGGQSSTATARPSPTGPASNPCLRRHSGCIPDGSRASSWTRRGSAHRATPSSRRSPRRTSRRGRCGSPCTCSPSTGM